MLKITDLTFAFDKKNILENFSLELNKGEILASLVKDIWPKVETGEVRPTIFKIMPAQQANEAHALLRDGKSCGKVILTFKN